MALQIETIPFTIPTPAGATTFTINHVRYPSTQAKAYLFVCASNFGINTPETWGLGVDDGSNHIGTSLGVSDNIFDANGILSARSISSVYSIVTIQSQVFFGGAQQLLSGYVSALNVGSCTVTLDLNNAPGQSWYAVMIGGDGVECSVGFYDVSGGSGTKTIGFDPVALITVGCPGAGLTNALNGSRASYGFATACGPEQVGVGIDRTFAAASSYQLDGHIQVDITAGSTTVTDEVTIASYPSNGVTFTVSGSPNFNIGYLAIGGTAVSANLVSITQPTSTGLQNTAITATDPTAVFFFSTDKVATSPNGSADANLTFGVYDGVDTLSQWWGNVSSASRLKHRRTSTTAAITMATAAGGDSSTLNAAASVTLASTNIATTWTTADSTQREVWALVLAQNLTGSTNTCGANPQASITVIKQCTPIAGGETEFPFGTTGGLSPSTFTLLDGESQLFSAISPGTYGITESAPSGWTASYAVSNGDSHSAITVTGTEAITVTTTNTFQSSTPTFRIYRRFALPYDEHYFTYLNRLEIVAQMGVGNSAAPSPTIRIRFSKDGGSTFGDFRTMSLGAAAQYTKRAYINRVGRGRDLVAEVICDDPVVVAWVQCLVEGEKATGTN